MKEVIFKVLYALFFAYGLFLFKQLSENGRYQPRTDTAILDTRTGILYFWQQGEGWNVHNTDGSWKPIKELPR